LRVGAEVKKGCPTRKTIPKRLKHYPNLKYYLNLNPTINQKHTLLFFRPPVLHSRGPLEIMNEKKHELGVARLITSTSKLPNELAKQTAFKRWIVTERR